MTEEGKYRKESRSRKRSQPDHDTSLEDKAFQKSKVTSRSPTKITPLKKQEMEDIKKLLAEMKRDLKKEMEENKKEIRDGIYDLKKDLTDLRTETRENKEEIQNLRQEIEKKEESWIKEKNELRDKLAEMEERLETLERDKRRNNLVITGIKINTDNEEILKEAIQNMIEKEIGLQIEVTKAYKVGEKICIIETKNWNDKMEILKKKSVLKNRPKGQEIYINPDYTVKERIIQKKIREFAKKEREHGISVKVKFQKVEVEGKLWKWSKKEDKLIEDKIREDSKN
ncbi:hypothetical protein Zmor_006792 [Zophobas morio]|uniref:Endonuclease-reverse transcriptase n=1 Tax=Zophobas morio TaxID=2755281 RepID=A0AA38IY81_9CUCU|nr:hypothetical protein Zmor_006792 [Zophobas morio]